MFFDEAFKNSPRKVKKLIVPSSVKEICQYAFEDIVTDEIIIPDSVTRIGDTLHLNLVLMDLLDVMRNRLLIIIPFQTISEMLLT